MFAWKKHSSRQLFSLDKNFQTVLLDSLKLIMGTTEHLALPQSYTRRLSRSIDAPPLATAYIFTVSRTSFVK